MTESSRLDERAGQGSNPDRAPEQSGLSGPELEASSGLSRWLTSAAGTPPPGDPRDGVARPLSALAHPNGAGLRQQYVRALQRQRGNAFVREAIRRTATLRPGRALDVEQAGIQRQEKPASSEATEKLYTLTLSTGTFRDLNEVAAIAKLWEAYVSLKRQVDLLSGEHETLKQSRDQNFFVGVGGFLADTFIGRDIPPLAMWEKPRDLLTAAKLALAGNAVEEGANILKEAGEAYKSCRDRYRTYTDELVMGGGATQVAIAAIPVAMLVIGIAWVMAAPGAAAAGTGTAATGAASGGTGATATGTGAATGATAAGGAVVGGGVTTAATTATTMATGNTVAGIAARAAALMASGDLQALTAFLTSMAATPGGRQAILNAAQLVVVSMQSPGVVQREFQFLKQLSELLFQFARGGG